MRSKLFEFTLKGLQRLHMHLLHVIGLDLRSGTPSWPIAKIRFGSSCILLVVIRAPYLGMKKSPLLAIRNIPNHRIGAANPPLDLGTISDIRSKGFPRLLSWRIRVRNLNTTDMHARQRPTLSVGMRLCSLQNGSKPHFQAAFPSMGVVDR